LAQAALGRNNPCNTHATDPEKPRNNTPATDPGLLRVLRSRLERIAAADGIDLAIVERLPDDDLAACIGLPDATLRAYVIALRDSDLRRCGKVPTGETATIRCTHCGPVFADPAVAAVLPVVRGMPTAAGCPWCHVRDRGLIPRPG
jgi:hypothetical protein